MTVPSNGIFLKIVIVALASASVGSAGALVKLYREVGELRISIDGLAGARAQENTRRLATIEQTVVQVGLDIARIALEQARRTNRLEVLERDVNRNREDLMQLKQRLR